MPFGVRGVRPALKGDESRYYEARVSNAFRREGRSPRYIRVRCLKGHRTVSNAFRREGRSPLEFEGPEALSTFSRSPMPFGVRGVRPSIQIRANIFEVVVSNAFRREGRSPPFSWPAGPILRLACLQCLSA